jgi:hypothetical protein
VIAEDNICDHCQVAIGIMELINSDCSRGVIVNNVIANVIMEGGLCVAEGGNCDLK